MTIAEWLAARTPRPPEVLSSRIEAVLGSDAARDRAAAFDVLLSASERVMRALLQSRCTTRESALDLLTADALVTYAFEAATDSPDLLVERASRAMTRIAALGAASSDAGA